jgi:hypothetical protein
VNTFLHLNGIHSTKMWTHSNIWMKYDPPKCEHIDSYIWMEYIPPKCEHILTFEWNTIQQNVDTFQHLNGIWSSKIWTHSNILSTFATNCNQNVAMELFHVHFISVIHMQKNTTNDKHTSSWKQNDYIT